MRFHLNKRIRATKKDKDVDFQFDGSVCNAIHVSRTDASTITQNQTETTDSMLMYT